MTRRALLYASFLAVLTSPLAAQDDINTIGPRVGSALPGFSGIDQFGTTHTLQSTLAANGAMVVFFRSADW